MGIFVMDPLQKEIKRLEKALQDAKTEYDRAQIRTTLNSMYELDTKRRANQLHVTGDGLAKCAVVLGLGIVGAIVENRGGILPKWSQTNRLL